MNTFKRGLAIVVTASALSMPAFASVQDAKDAVSDAWVDGSVETALMFNSHLNNFEIQTDVKDGVVTLSGAVETDVDRDLAVEIAKGVRGVKSVNNELTVDGKRSKMAIMKANAGEQARDFRQWFDDVSTTAAVKSKLLANASTDGLKIDVSTRGNVVSLDGEVDSSEESELAEAIASNVRGVTKVDNRLRVAAR
ncbi:MAG: BON domain-containing protein [Nevskiales bacterium]|nr:BON domain-containing protein [Nevskiales bacterium]